ncbi:MAG: DUF805 domain-containing protein [Nesterenkonia sp.]|nr:DUF805 domain-containing protein [Nesterenkonia sp.]
MAQHVSIGAAEVGAESYDRPPLSRPLYGADPLQAASRMVLKAARFSGYASRSEFLWAGLVLSAAGTLLVGAHSLLRRSTEGSFASTPFLTDTGLLALITPLGLISALAWAAYLVITLSLMSRRLHDAGISAAAMLVGLIPLVGGLGLLILLMLPSRPEMRCFEWDDLRRD